MFTVEEVKAYKQGYRDALIAIGELLIIMDSANSKSFWGESDPEPEQADGCH